MRGKKKVKPFDGYCKANRLLIDQNGTPLCKSKKSPKSRKYDINPCALDACSNYVSKTKEELEGLTEKQKKIWKLLEKEKSSDYIIENVPCGIATYYRVKKLFDEHKEILEKEQIEHSKIESINEPEEKTQKINQAPTSDSAVQYQKVKQKTKEESKTKLKPPEIKLCLYEFKDYRTAIQDALNNQYRWTPYNIKEIKDYLYSLRGVIYPYPKWLEYLDKLLWLHEHSRPLIPTRVLCSPYYIPIAKTTPNHIYFKRLTVREIFKLMNLDLPEQLENEARDIVKNLEQLELTGIFEDLKEKIREPLGIETEAQLLIDDYKKGDLDKLGKRRLMSKIQTNENISSNPYYQKILEDLKKDIEG